MQTWQKDYIPELETNKADQIRHATHTLINKNMTLHLRMRDIMIIGLGTDIMRFQNSKSEQRQPSG